MIFTTIRRILRTGFISFWRNGFVSFTSIVVLTTILFTLGILGFGGVMLNSALQELKDKVDINVYFDLDAPEDNINSLKSELEKIPEVSVVEYISREKALSEFRQKNKDNITLLQGLDELEENPLPASLNIKAKEPSQYQGIASYLESSNIEAIVGSGMIEKINYLDNKKAIDKLSQLIETSRFVALVLAIVLVLISVLVTFSTVKLAIYSFREEISVMQLVGASRSYIRGPFVVEGGLCGMIAAIIVLIVFYPALLWLGPIAERTFGAINLFAYYLSNFGLIFFISIISGVILGAGSSYIAVRRYLKI